MYCVYVYVYIQMYMFVCIFDGERGKRNQNSERLEKDHRQMNCSMIDTRQIGEKRTDR